MQAPSTTPGPKSADKIKVAVLGGGVGALTAALRLTATQADRDRHEVTVWQMGWRLGGKCASGRDMSHPPAARVLEHGLHIFAGFYHNAFLTLKDCYEELGGAGGVPAADVFDAFRPQNRVMLVEREGGRDIPWPMDFLPMPGLPGEGEAVPSVAHFVEALLHAIYSHYVGGAGKPDHGGERAPHASVAALPAHLAARVGAAVAAVEPEFVARFFHHGPHKPPVGDAAAADPHGLHHAIVVARAGKLDVQAPAGAHFPDVLALLRRFETHLETALHVGALEDWLRRIRRGVNLATAVIAGMTAADAANKGFDALDGQELKTWLKSHGA